MSSLNGGRGIPEPAATSRQLKQNTKDLSIKLKGHRLGHLEMNAQRFSPSSQHGKSLGKNLRIHEKTMSLRALANRKAEAHRLSSCRSLIKQRSIGDRQPRELTDQRLEVEQSLEPSLRDLSLIRGVSGIPSRIFKHLSLNQRRRCCAVIAKPN